MLTTVTRTTLAVALATALAASAQTSTGTAPALAVVQCDHYVDVTAGRTLGATSIVIAGDKVREVVAGKVAPDGATVIALPADHTCMPGWIDSHTHITGETSAKSYEEGFRLNPADMALRGTRYANTTLMAGFTTVRNLGDGANASISLRNAIDAGFVAGPRIVSAGKSIATTGGHADPTNGRSFELSGDPGPKDGVINSPLEARKAVRQRYKDGADVIKVTATGGVLSYAKNGQNPQFQEDELQAVVATAHDYGMKVAAHAHGDEGIRRAVAAGVDSIEHGTFMSDATIRLMKERGTYYVPTISAGVFVAEKAKEPGYYPEIVRPKALAVGPQIQATFARAYKAGVRIAFGTDAAVFPHGQNAREFGLMVDAGMPPMAALQSATRDAADLLGRADSVGALKPGYFADIVAVPGDPVADIRVTERVAFVMKGGVVYKQP